MSTIYFTAIYSASISIGALYTSRHNLFPLHIVFVSSPWLSFCITFAIFCEFWSACSCLLSLQQHDFGIDAVGSFDLVSCDESKPFRTESDPLVTNKCWRRENKTQQMRIFTGEKRMHISRVCRKPCSSVSRHKIVKCLMQTHWRHAYFT